MSQYAPVEYEFTLPDGSKRFEFIVERGDVAAFMKMHGAVKAMPVRPSPTNEG